MVSKNLATQNNGIALTRLFVNLENVITCVGYFWILWELINLAEINKNRLKIFLISCIIFCVFDGIFYKFDGRRGTSFIIQLALTLRFFRIAESQPKQAQWLSVLIGASIPSSFSISMTELFILLSFIFVLLFYHYLLIKKPQLFGLEER